MKIAINIRNGETGAGRFIRSLVPALYRNKKDNDIYAIMIHALAMMVISLILRIIAGE